MIIIIPDTYEDILAIIISPDLVACRLFPDGSAYW